MHYACTSALADVHHWFNKRHCLPRQRFTLLCDTQFEMLSFADVTCTICVGGNAFAEAFSHSQQFNALVGAIDTQTAEVFNLTFHINALRCFVSTGVLFFG